MAFTLSIRKWMSLIILLTKAANCGLLAVGLPAAPPAEYMYSSREFESELRLLDTNKPIQRYQNLTTAASGNLSADVGPPPAFTDYWWLADTRFAHLQPHAGAKGYQAFRNVKDPKYGAKGDGQSDDWAAIMRAVMDGDRCGWGCNATSTKGAIVYFPPGNYSISKSIIQYYFTVFIGHPSLRPVIKGRSNFKGIALIDTDVYDDKTGDSYWINQNNFYRQIRNFVLDMTEMPRNVTGGPFGGAPVGIHWQVSQACTLQNIEFLMPPSGPKTQHLGIFMENGSGGFVSDLIFRGGKVGFVAGNQQYTARDLKFVGCEVAIEMLWSWGFTWKNIDVQFSKIAINATAKGAAPTDAKTDPAAGPSGDFQSTGSITILDSVFKNCDVMLKVAKYDSYTPSVVLDHIRLEAVHDAVIQDGGKVLLAGGTNIDSWATGRRYTQDVPKGIHNKGKMVPPRKDRSLLDEHGNFFEHDKPQYVNFPKELVRSVLEFGARNDGVYPNNNTAAINWALRETAQGLNRKVLVFPAGVYKVDGEIFVPPGAMLVGVLWPQIMAVGKYFENADEPHVLMKVGRVGDQGSVEISDLIFTNSGPTAGAIFMEWNMREQSQGSAAMWGTIFRVGGTDGTGLRINTCDKDVKQDYNKCMASSMMLHVTTSGTIYMEDVWLWVADHDVDAPAQNQINVYGARGVLIESQGPSWVSSVSNEHSTLYNWQLAGARNIYLGHIQSETPYFQAGQTPSLEPYPPSDYFAYDPEFPDCNNAAKIDTCREAWALRVIKSSNVYLYGGGFYSFFNQYSNTCSHYGQTKVGSQCQDKIVDTDYSENIWLYNIFTVGVTQSLSPQGFPAVLSESEQNGFATATSAYLVLADSGGNIGGTRKGRLQSEADETEPRLCPDREFASFEEMDAAQPPVTSWCAYLYAMPIFTKMVEDALEEFKWVSNGYDKVWPYYQDEARAMIKKQLSDFMDDKHGKGLKYFMCTPEGFERKRCDDISARAWDYDNELYEWIDDTAEKRFYEELMEETGIPKEGIYWSSKESKYPKSLSGTGKNGTADPIIWHMKNGFPSIPFNYPITNPKDILTKAADGMKEMIDKYWVTHLQMLTGTWDGDHGDIFDTYSASAFMVVQALENMQKAKEIGKKGQDAATKNIVLAVLNAVFLLLPFAGGAGSALTGLTAIGRGAGLIGLAGSTTVGVYEAFEDPKMAPMAILGILLGAKGFGGLARAGAVTEKDVADMVALRAQITPRMAKGLGSSFEKNDELRKKIGSRCRI